MGYKQAKQTKTNSTVRNDIGEAVKREFVLLISPEAAMVNTVYHTFYNPAAEEQHCSPNRPQIWQFIINEVNIAEQLCLV